jgi:hypothetical protein
MEAYLQIFKRLIAKLKQQMSQTVMGKIKRYSVSRQADLYEINITKL